MSFPADSSLGRRGAITQLEESVPLLEYYCPSCEKTFEMAGRCPTDGTTLVRLAAHLDPLLGAELNDRYTILESLGEGGMGAVYRGSQHGLGREVAIKVVRANLMADPEAIKRFLREAKLASRLAHPNAVSVLEFGQTSAGLLFLVMELVVGCTLDLVFKREGAFTPERVVRIGTQVCSALEGAHALQIIHRDLKPSNIMLLSSGGDLVKVLDFGLAKSLAPDQTPTTMTKAGVPLGTPAFMPPEVALGEPCDARADLYSLGCVLYLLGSGTLPFRAGTAHELIAMHGTEDARPMTGVPPALAAVVDRLLARNPADRFQTAVATREALEAALAAKTSQPVPRLDTSPSLGPFSEEAPAVIQGAGRLAAFERAANPSDIRRFVSGDTMLAKEDGAAPIARGGVARRAAGGAATRAADGAAPRPSSRLGFISLGVFALGAGGVTYALVRAQRSEPERVSVVAVPEPAAIASAPEAAIAASPAAPTAPASGKRRDDRRSQATTTHPDATPQRAYIENASKALRARTPQLVTCFNTNEFGKGETIKATIVIGSDGIAKQVSFSPERVNDSPLGSCLRAEIQRVQFPRGDREQTFSIPLRTMAR